jgi:drug/metabolite transporter (DMT)-like permease
MRTRIIAVLGAASFGWGLAGVGVRAVYQQGATTFTVIVVRTAVATLAVILFGAVSQKVPDKSEWLHGSLIGILRIGFRQQPHRRWFGSRRRSLRVVQRNP